MNARDRLRAFGEVNIVDTEYMAPRGENPLPICVCAQELFSGKKHTVWFDEPPYPPCPYDLSENSLFVSYNASAEESVHIALGWPQPANTLDLLAEFRHLMNNVTYEGKRSLVAAAEHYGLPNADQAYKDRMTARCIQGPPFTPSEKHDILKYCHSDVTLTTALLNLLIDKDQIFFNDDEVNFALFRGEYTSALAHVEYHGIPLDKDLITRFKANWDDLFHLFIDKVNPAYNVYEKYRLRKWKFLEYVMKEGIPWEIREKSGLPRMDDDYMKEKAIVYPQLQELRQTMILQNKLKIRDLPMDKNGYNRTHSMPFRAKTGRNQPKASENIFGASAMFRNNIRAHEEGYAFAALDFAQEEYRIAGVLSGDLDMQQAYEEGDYYINLAIAVGAAPPGATKQSHPLIREEFKQLALAVNYGQSPQGFAKRAGIPEIYAEHLFKQIKNRFPVYWHWIEQVTDKGFLELKISTCLGWRLQTAHEKWNTVMNFTMQGHGSEILHLCVCNLVRAGLPVCGTLHDAVFLEDTIENIETTVQKASEIMIDASKQILCGHAIRVDTKIFPYPEHYYDARSAGWDKLIAALEEVERAKVK